MAGPLAKIAVIGGSGLYALFDSNPVEISPIATPYGEVNVSVGNLGGREIVFLPRHGGNHSVPPHLINYRANIWALASIGVRAIISSAAVGGLGPGYPVGSLVLTDQYLDFTYGRAATFFDEDSVQHLPSADPFCQILHEIARTSLGNSVVATGTVAVIQGPRFSTRAESRRHIMSGADMVNMTLCPEVPLASELNIGTVNLAFVTDGDANAHDSAASEVAMTAEVVFARLVDARPRIVQAISAIAVAIPENYRTPQLIDPDAVAGVLARRAR